MKRRLGKGIAALIPTAEDVKKNNELEINKHATSAGNTSSSRQSSTKKESSKTNPIDIFFESSSKASNVSRGGSVSSISSSTLSAAKRAQQESIENFGIYFDEISLDKIKVNFKQPRTIFNDQKLEELAASIKEVGVLQPVIVRENQNPEDKDKKPFELIMGERRFRASRLAKKKTIPAVVKQTEDSEMLRTALIENIHRVDLTPIEEASAYKQLMSDFNFTQQELSEKIGISRSKIANMLRLLKLPPVILRALDEEKISVGHARALLAMGSDEKILEVYRKIIRNNLNVRQVEAIAAVALGEENPKRKTRRSIKDILSIAEQAKYKEFEEELEDLLSTDVSLEVTSKGKKISISFADAEDLQRIIRIIKGKN